VVSLGRLYNYYDDDDGAQKKLISFFSPAHSLFQLSFILSISIGLRFFFLFFVLLVVFVLVALAMFCFTLKFAATKIAKEKFLLNQTLIVSWCVCKDEQRLHWEKRIH